MNAHVLKVTLAMELYVKVSIMCVEDSTQFSEIHSPDTDECTTVPNICSQECNNTIGSYNCSCEEGYVLESDGYNCTGKHSMKVYSMEQCVICLCANV